MSFNFPDTILRQTHARNISQEIADMASRTDFEQALEDASSEARALVQANQQLLEQEGAKKLAEEFDQAVEEAPVFRVILAVYPHDLFMKELGEWFRREIHAHSLFRVDIRRSIGGGIVVRSKNRVFDMSFRPQVLEAKNKIPEIVRNV